MTEMSEQLRVASREDLVGPLRLRINGAVVEVSEFASSNPNKYAEYRAVGLAVDEYRLDQHGIHVPEKQVDGPLLDQLIDRKFAEVASNIAADKAEALYRATGRPMLVGDISLGVYAAPAITGPNIKLSCATEQGLEDLCFLATRHDTRLALAIANLAVFDGEHAKVWQATVQGQLAYAPVGENGFGWDKIFMPEPHIQQAHMDRSPQTWAQMTTEEKLTLFPLRGAVVDKLRESVVREA